MRVRVVCVALLCAALALPASAAADHGIAPAVRSSGEALPAGSGGQDAGGALISGLRTTPGALEQVGHSPLLNRGMNAALAVKGDYAYVGSRTDGTHLNAGVLVVDVSRPRQPRVVGEIGPPLEGNPGETSRELRIWPEQNLLLVLNHGCSELIHRCAGGQAVRSTIRFYDISGRNAASPELVSTFLPSRSRPQVPHEFFLWIDPDDPARALIYYTNPSGSDQELIVTDISGAREGRFAEIDEFKVDLPENGMDNRLHSLGISNDGTRGYLAYLGGGFMVVDTSDFAHAAANPQVRLITPVEQRVFWTDPGAHSAVKLFGRPFALTTDEVYGKLGGVLADHGCPWGWARTIDIADERSPRLVGEYRVGPHNFEDYCDQAPPDQENLSSQSAHNPTLTPNLALITWHSRGFQLISTEDPAQPRRLAEFSPQPLPAVQTEDPALSSGRDKVVMWSYPIVKDGLIYLIDLRNGLYILRYRGPCQEELRGVRFLEGNSNAGDALRFEGSATGSSYAGPCAPYSGAPAPADPAGRSAAAPSTFPGGGFGSAELRRD
jgi:LVIVD repeat